eukprot:TRINITY_DN3550_c0_g1_i1.p1 TRINITY_DN3550_c0_g1~~TRINITY_DN3550_c0_g1_i1.p1  ORF type:complete len:524 (-),score=141.30 TRINITY_DN3550_c0_g1_i1:99-1670(-)
MSTPTKKKRSPKLKETEEMRRVRMELAAMREEEKKRKKEDTLRVMLQQRLSEEITLSRTNTLAIQTKWRQIMRLVKVEELQREIEVLSQQHEREVDRKDAIISQLEKDLDDIESQYQTALRSHLSNVDKLIELHDNRLKTLEREADRDKSGLVAEYENEYKELEAKHEESCKEILYVVSLMEEEHKSLESEARQEVQGARQDIKDKNSEDFSALRINLDTKIDQLEKMFEQANQSYTDSTTQQTQRFKELTEQDLANARTIELNARKLTRLQDALTHWRAKMQTNVREGEERNKALKEEKDAVLAYFQELKGRMNKFREVQQARLAELTQNVDKTVRTLKKKQELAEKILGLHEVNQKLETEAERMMIFDNINTTDTNQNNPQIQQTTPTQHPPVQLPNIIQAPSPSPYSTAATTRAGNQVTEWDYLSFFFRKFNKVELDKAALEHERERLQQENNDLKNILKQYLDGVSVNDDVLSNVNPLLIINGGRTLENTASGSAASTPKPKARVTVPQQVVVVQRSHQ